MQGPATPASLSVALQDNAATPAPPSSVPALKELHPAPSATAAHDLRAKRVVASLTGQFAWQAAISQPVSAWTAFAHGSSRGASTSMHPATFLSTKSPELTTGPTPS